MKEIFEFGDLIGTSIAYIVLLSFILVVLYKKTRKRS